MLVPPPTSSRRRSARSRCRATDSLTSLGRRPRPPSNRRAARGVPPVAPFEMPRYAASRTRRARTATVLAPRPPVGRGRCVRGTRCAASSSVGPTSGASARSAAIRNRRPSTEARSRIRRGSGRAGRAGRRAAPAGSSGIVTSHHPNRASDRRRGAPDRQASPSAAPGTAGSPRRSRRRLDEGRGRPVRAAARRPAGRRRTSGGRVVVIARGFPAAQVGRCSSSSGLRGTGTGRDRARARPPSSARSSIGGSAQWTSSSTTTRGRSEARTSNRRRTAHAASAADASPTPRIWASRSPTDAPSGCPATRSRSAAATSSASPEAPAACESSSTSGANVTPLTVGGRLPDENRRAFADLVCERGGQPRLADAGGSQNGNEHARLASIASSSASSSLLRWRSRPTVAFRSDCDGPNAQTR